MGERRNRVVNKLKQIIKHYWENVTWLEGILLVLPAFVLMYVLLYKLGTLSSGYHFLDDHELIRLQVAFEDNGQSLGNVMQRWIDNDLRWRFRPFYWVERTFLAYFFGANLLYWNIYTAIKGIITFVLLYFTARYLKCNPIISAIFTGLILYGEQITPWYRSANQENTGLMLCALAMCLIAAQAYYKKYQSVVFNVLIVMSVVLCGLVKESFTLMMPALMGAKFWLEYREDIGLNLWECFKRNWLTYGIVLVSFLVNIYMLVFQVGVDQVSYAGFHKESNLAEYWQGIVRSYQLYLRWYVNAAVILLAVLILRAGKSNWKKYIGFVLLSCYVIVIQLVAHAKSGMWERYLIPWIVGYAALFVILGYKMLKHRKISKWIYLLVLCVLIYLEAPLALPKGRDYAYDGRMTAVYFQTILDHTDENSHIISAFFDDELNLSTECWLESRERTQVYSVNPDTGELMNKVQLKGSAPDNLDWKNAKVVTCYANQVDGMLEDLGLSEPTQCTVYVNGNYAVICIGETSLSSS